MVSPWRGGGGGVARGGGSQGRNRSSKRSTHARPGMHISQDIHNLPTFWVLALFGTFYNFCFRVQTCRHLGGGYVYTF